MNKNMETGYQAALVSLALITSFDLTASCYNMFKTLWARGRAVFFFFFYTHITSELKRSSSKTQQCVGSRKSQTDTKTQPETCFCPAGSFSTVLQVTEWEGTATGVYTGQQIANAKVVYCRLSKHCQGLGQTEVKPGLCPAAAYLICSGCNLSVCGVWSLNMYMQQRVE